MCMVSVSVRPCRALVPAGATGSALVKKTRIVKKTSVTRAPTVQHVPARKYIAFVTLGITVKRC